MTKSEHLESVQRRIHMALHEGIAYATVCAIFEGERYVLDHLYPNEAAWNLACVALTALELRWPQAAIEGVRVRPVPDSVVRAR
jgi:hypothetical protein